MHHNGDLGGRERLLGPFIMLGGGGGVVWNIILILLEISLNYFGFCLQSGWAKLSISTLFFLTEHSEVFVFFSACECFSAYLTITASRLYGLPWNLESMYFVQRRSVFPSSFKMDRVVTSLSQLRAERGLLLFTKLLVTFNRRHF